MSHQKQDQERFRRIRDRQISLRDPQERVNQLQHSISRRRKRSMKGFSFKTMIQEVPNKYVGLVLGMTIGVVILVVLPGFIDPPWGDVVGFASIIFLGILGFLFGQGMDTRDELKDLVK